MSGQPDLPVAEARRRIAAAIAPLGLADSVPLLDALGRVLAGDVRAPVDVPGHDNAAMDGYALRGADLAAGDAALVLDGTALAGHPHLVPVGAGRCVRITTGAALPPACDTVVPHEVTRADGERIVVPAGAVRPGAHVRLRGEDLAEGSLALAAGTRLGAAEIGLLASLGLASVAVARAPRVALFSTGDELCAPGAPRPAAGVYDSNRYTLHCMLRRLGCEVLDLGIVADEPGALAAALAQGCAQADLVLTSGGMAAGAADHTRRVLAAHGDIAFWSLAMRPGRPLAFGRLQSGGDAAWLFGLPGNPVAVMVSFALFVRPALLRLMGAQDTAPLLRALADESIRKKPGRTEFLRATLLRGADGETRVRPSGAQGSAMLSAMARADCLLVLDAERGDVAAGEAVDVMPLEGLL